jgi:hypothetical protein
MSTWIVNLFYNYFAVTNRISHKPCSPVLFCWRICSTQRSKFMLDLPLPIWESSSTGKLNVTGTKSSPRTSKESVKRNMAEWRPSKSKGRHRSAPSLAFSPCYSYWPQWQGEIYVKFDAIDSAKKAIQGLNGRWFGGKQVSAVFISDAIMAAHQWATLLLNFLFLELFSAEVMTVWRYWYLYATGLLADVDWCSQSHAVYSPPEKR